MIFDTATLTDPGMVRENNEDSSLAVETSIHVKPDIVSSGIYIVADGMGGHQAGEVASKMAVQTISKTLLDTFREAKKLPPPALLVKQAFDKANAEIYASASSNPKLSSMGTTVTLGLRLDNRLYLGHVGDSRAYLIREGAIKQLTEDHSVVAQLLKAGMITPEEAKTHPDQGKIFRCLGTTAEVAIDTYSQTGKKDSLILQNGDSFVFCTDGLTGHVTDSEILDCVQKGNDANSTCRDLILMANLRGGEDNISLIVVRVKADTSQNTRPKSQG